MQFSTMYRRYRSSFAAALLAAWLLAPTITGLWISRYDIVPWVGVVTIVFTLVVLLAPLALLGTVRRLFLFWLPFGFVAPAHIYFTNFFNAVPADGMMLSLLNTHAAEAKEMLSGFGWIVLVLPLAWACYALLLAQIGAGPRLQASQRKNILAVVLFYALGCILASTFLAPERGEDHGLPELASERARAISYPWGAVESLARVASNARNDDGLPWMALGATAPQDELLVVLIISESLRADHLGINGYARDTTPELKKLGPELMTFSNVASTANYTSVAVPNLMGRMEGEGRVSIVSAFREAGFRTAWISNQDSFYAPGADIMRFTENSWKTGIRYDPILLPQFSECLHHCGSRQFITLHLMGSHFPYDARYPPSERKFVPTFVGREKKGVNFRNKVELVNSYDNTIVATDRLLSKFIEQVRASGKPALVMVTADHGENLYDDERRLVLHSGDKPSRADTFVPLVIWTNEQFRRKNAEKMAALASHRGAPISHRHLMPTVLDLAGVNYPAKKAEESFASPLFKPGKRSVGGEENRPIDVELLR